MSEQDGYDSFEDDIIDKNHPSTSSNSKSSTRKRSAVLLNRSNDNIIIEDDEDSFDKSLVFDSTPKRARIVSPIKKRSPKRIIEEPISIHDSNVDGFPSLVDLSITSNSNRHLHLSVLSSVSSDGTTTLTCKQIDETEECIVYLQGMWSQCQIHEGTSIRLINPKRWSDTEWLIDDEEGLLVTQTDTLVPCTTVVQSFFCQRKAVLSERLKGGSNSVSKAMLMGIIIHELFQAALLTPPSFHLTKEWLLSRWRDNIMDEVIVSLTAVNLTEENFESELEPYVEVIVNWVNSYMPHRSNGIQKKIEGECMINEVHDIEENIWMPALGLKGKVDVSLEVSSESSNSSWLLPLELKTGKSGASADHAGQVLMYTMMLAHRYSLSIHEGSLLYLKDGTMRRVIPKASELRAIISRRNEVSSYIGKGSIYHRLPLPRSDSHFCKRCDYSQSCTLYGRAYENDKNDKENEEKNNDEGISDEAYSFQLQMTQHLQSNHIDYFKRWMRWHNLESVTSRRDKRPLSDLWSIPATKREEQSPLTCMANLHVEKCEEMEGGGKYKVTLARIRSSPSQNIYHSICNIGDFVIVSTDSAPAVVMGPVVGVDRIGESVSIVSDRKLPLENERLIGNKNMKMNKEEVYHLDKHESMTVHSIQLNNIIMIMSDDERCNNLRRLIIDLNEPSVTKIKSGEVAIVKKIVKGLIPGQIAAVVKCLCASDYALIEGLPGSGKTSTLVALVRSIVALGHSVLVTAYTHSAVDNLLDKIAKDIPSESLLRLGRSSSVHSSVQSLTLQYKLSHCTTPTEKYDRAKFILAKTPVVAASSLSISTNPLFSWRRFSICIVDESSLVLESSLLAALLSSNRFVLVGDDKQLKPLVQNREASDEGMSISLFERLLSAHGNKHSITLDKQFRMNKVVSSIASSLFYSDRLICANDTVSNACLSTVHPEYDERFKKRMKDHPSTRKAIISAVDGNLDHSAIFIDVPIQDEINDTIDDESPLMSTISVSSNGISNEREVEVIKELIEEFQERGLPLQSIGVMAVYRKQVELLKRNLPVGVEVNTVDQWQGRDSEIVICSLAWTIAHGRKRSDLLSDERRINVAVTRAKYKLILVGCGRSMRERCPLVSSVIDRMIYQKIQ